MLTEDDLSFASRRAFNPAVVMMYSLIDSVAISRGSIAILTGLELTNLCLSLSIISHSSAKNQNCSLIPPQFLYKIPIPRPDVNSVKAETRQLCNSLIMLSCCSFYDEDE